MTIQLNIPNDVSTVANLGLLKVISEAVNEAHIEALSKMFTLEISSTPYESNLVVNVSLKLYSSICLFLGRRP